MHRYLQYFLPLYLLLLRNQMSVLSFRSAQESLLQLLLCFQHPDWSNYHIEHDDQPHRWVFCSDGYSNDDVYSHHGTKGSEGGKEIFCEGEGETGIGEYSQEGPALIKGKDSVFGMASIGKFNYLDHHARLLWAHLKFFFSPNCSCNIFIELPIITSFAFHKL